MTYELSSNDLRLARTAFDANEPRNIFYRAATELVGLAIRGETSLTVGEALSVLLQTWNKAYYQYHKFNNAHLTNIENLVADHRSVLVAFRARSIDSLDNRDHDVVNDLFQDFENVLGPVGAAKTLHLMAPDFFPLWDRKIAKGYDLPLGRSGSNGNRYCQFLLISQIQCRALKQHDAGALNRLRAIDEYNYCKYTKTWL